MNWVYSWYQLIIFAIYTCHSIEMKQRGIHLLFPLVLRICNVTHKYKHPEHSKSVYLAPFPRRNKLMTFTVRVSLFISRWWRTEPPASLHYGNLTAYSTVFDHIGSHNCRLGLRASAYHWLRNIPEGFLAMSFASRYLCTRFVASMSIFHPFYIGHK